MKSTKLTVEPRTVLGKKVKKLRREGTFPANVYGKDIKSISVQLPIKTFLTVFNEVHETGLVDLSVNGETLPVLIHNVQIDPRTRMAVHADFFKVNLKEKIAARIPVVAIGEAKAIADRIGLLEQPVSELEIEALPTDLPEKIEVSVENLAQIGEQISVENIKAPEGVTILNEPSQVVFKIGELVTKEVEEEAAAEEAAAEAAAEAEAAEGGEAAPAEGAAEEKPEQKEESSEAQVGEEKSTEQ